MTQPLDLGALEITPDPVAEEVLARRRADQIERYRRIGLSNLEAYRAGRKFAADVLADSRRWAAYPVLDRALGTGEPE